MSEEKSIPCAKEGCTGFGTFDPAETGGQCPGSDDESHHCVAEGCGELWWDEKGLRCDICRDYYCPIHWQTTFVTIDCEHNKGGLSEEEAEDSDYSDDAEMICAECYEMNEKYHCKVVGCYCSQNYDKIYKETSAMQNLDKK